MILPNIRRRSAKDQAKISNFGLAPATLIDDFTRYNAHLSGWHEKRRAGE